MTSQTSYCRCEQSYGICHINEQQGRERLGGLKRGGQLDISSLICLINKNLADTLWSCHLGPLHSQLIPITEENRSLITEAEKLLCVYVRLIVYEKMRVDVSARGHRGKGSRGREGVNAAGGETNSHYVSPSQAWSFLKGVLFLLMTTPNHFLAYYFK